LAGGAIAAAPAAYGAPLTNAELAFAGGLGAHWLGLNGNSSDPSDYLGGLDEFATEGIVYDRGNGVEWQAGRLPTEGAWGRGLATSIDAGMVPVVTIEFRAYGGPRCDPGRDCLPSGAAAQSYVAGFVRSARAMLAEYPHSEILFEPINEPYLHGTATQYAAILARLLPAAARAHIPLTNVYVAATGNGWLSELYTAQPSLRRLVAAWYVHPYGPPGAAGIYEGGIRSLPTLRAEMASGRDNVIVSELGYCAQDLPSGWECPPGPYTLATSAQAATNLTEALAAALLYHEQGWLKALLVYGRGSYQGWGMQLPGGALTAEGEALEAFAALL
jgi:hypothetical protein